MSYYTTVLVTMSPLDIENAGRHLSHSMPRQSHHVLSQLRAPGDGTLSATAIWEGDFKNLDVPAFTWWIAHLPWAYPEEVQAFLRGEADDRFAVWQIEGGELVCILPGRD